MGGDVVTHAQDGRLRAAAAGLGDPEGNGPVKRGPGPRAARVVVPVLVRVVVKRAGRDRAPGALVPAFGL